MIDIVGICCTTPALKVIGQRFLQTTIVRMTNMSTVHSSGILVGKKVMIKFNDSNYSDGRMPSTTA